MNSTIQRALITAYDLHQGQERKCSNQAPYFVHILDVAGHLMAEPTATEDVIIAGILHDTLEDTPYIAPPFASLLSSVSTGGMNMVLWPYASPEYSTLKVYASEDDEALLPEPDEESLSP